MRYTGMHEHTTHMQEGEEREEGMKGGREESQDPLKGQWMDIKTHMKKWMIAEMNGKWFFYHYDKKK